jgi:probable F420-dependent oxidoreductase
MQIGVAIFCTEYTIGPVALARGLEERGLDVLMFPEHSHIPASRATPFPSGGELPREYKYTVDPFVGLAAAAAVTERLLIGTGVCLVTQRDPIHTAKAVATLDRISNGRFLFGIGAGWNREEMENHGTDFDSRFRLMRERIEAMKALWRDEEAAYHGRLVDFDPLWQWPKPVQKPHPPILIGGHGPHVFDRVIRYGDEWLPIGRALDPDKLESARAELDRRAADAGRGEIPVTVYGCEPDLARLEGYAEAGAHRVLFWMGSVGGAEAERQLDRFADLKSRFDGRGG